MGRVVGPSVRVAAQRRRLLLWLPMLVLGAVASLAGGPLVTVFNSLDGAGLVLIVAGLLGFLHEMDK